MFYYVADTHCKKVFTFTSTSAVFYSKSLFVLLMCADHTHGNNIKMTKM